MVDNHNEKENRIPNQKIIDDVEVGSFFNKDNKRIKAIDFINVLAEMLNTYEEATKSEDKKPA